MGPLIYYLKTENGHWIFTYCIKLIIVYDRPY
jgi:hypothetical protein